MKKLIFLITFLTLLFILPHNAKTVYAQDTNSNEFESVIDDLINELNLDNLQDLFNDYIGDESVKEIIKRAFSGEYLSFDELINTILSALKKNLVPITKTFATIISIVLICSIISSLKSTNEGIGDTLFIVCYCFVAIILFKECSVAVSEISFLINSLCKQLDAVFPILLTLLSVTGANSTVMVYQPISIIIANLSTKLVTKVLLPIINITSVTALTSNLNEKFSLKKLQEFFLSAFKWIVGLVVVIFSVFSVVKGGTASIYDNFSLRTFKYAVGNGFPLIGGFAKEGIDVIIASSIIIKNGVGTVSIFILFFALFTPFIRVTFLSLALKFLAGIIEPIADNRISNLISSFSKVINMLSTLLFMVFIIYCINFLLIISSQSGIFG